MSTTALAAPAAVVVKPSLIHGMGLFANQCFHPEDVIGLYEGPRVFTDDDDGPYVLWMEDDDGRVFGIDGQNALRYVNHDVAPNAAFYGDELIALRRIEPGEEITHDYGEAWHHGH